jgi:hypothetical protein
VTGDFDEWVSFMSSGIRAQSDAAVARIDRLLELRELMLLRVREAGSRGGMAYRLVDELVGYPVVDVPWLVKRHEVSYQAADKAVKRLVGLEILREIRRSGRTRKVFYSPEVLKALEA